MENCRTSVEKKSMACEQLGTMAFWRKKKRRGLQMVGWDKAVVREVSCVRTAAWLCFQPLKMSPSFVESLGGSVRSADAANTNQGQATMTRKMRFLAGYPRALPPPKSHGRGTAENLRPP